MNTTQLQQAHIDWVAASGFDVFATLKFCNGYDIVEGTAERILSIFLNKLDRTYYGKCDIRLGHRVPRFVYLHKGRSGQNTHYHIAFTALGSIEKFCATTHAMWANSFTETCGSTSQVTPVRSRLGTSIYALHEYRSLGDTTFHDKLSHTAPSITGNL